MLKHLLTVLAILITLSITAQPVFAVTTPTPPKAPTYQGIWQKMTLKRLLQKQGSATPSIAPSATPTPNVKAARTSRVTPKPTSKKTVTVIKTPTPSPIKAVSTPKPTAKPTAKPTTAPVAAAPATNDVTAYIMKEINDYRASQGLGSVQTSAETCNFAKTRAQEITMNFNHDGFNQRKENKTLPYTSWSAITENIAMTSNYKDVVTMWKNSSGHAANMRANTPYVCVMQSGNYYAYEGMKP